MECRVFKHKTNTFMRKIKKNIHIENEEEGKDEEKMRRKGGKKRGRRRRGYIAKLRE